MSKISQTPYFSYVYLKLLSHLKLFRFDSDFTYDFQMHMYYILYRILVHLMILKYIEVFKIQIKKKY